MCVCVPVYLHVGCINVIFVATFLSCVMSVGRKRKAALYVKDLTKPVCGDRTGTFTPSVRHVFAITRRTGTGTVDRDSEKHAEKEGFV